MARNPTAMDVVAAAIGDREGRWLLQQRPAGKRHAGLWEFPGGKVEQGETHEEALIREVNEELTIDVVVDLSGPVARATAGAADGEPQIVISLYKIALWDGSPVAEPGARIGWFTPEQIAELPLPPLDIELARQLFARSG
jgi:8-oxo-dGTP diphosphatase